MTSGCSKCCQDIDINPLDLLFPERLDERGKEFMDAHGILWEMTLEQIRDCSTVMSNGMLKVSHVCQKLDPFTNLCTIYETRPAICRDYVCEVRTGMDKCEQTIPLRLIRSKNDSRN